VIASRTGWVRANPTEYCTEYECFAFCVVNQSSSL
jgi:hypothetical protein